MDDFADQGSDLLIKDLACTVCALIVNNYDLFVLDRCCQYFLDDRMDVVLLVVARDNYRKSNIIHCCFLPPFLYQSYIV